MSVTFDRGTVTTLEGPNGAGKSTLLSVLATLIKPAAGRVLYDNLELPDDRARVRPAIGLVAHDALVYPDLTGRESLELFARLYRVARVPDAIAQVCEQYGLNSFIDRPARTLSRGQLQRLALARATVHRPSLLLFDEPTTGLDQASTERVANAIEASRALGRIVVVVTHDQALAARVATRRAHFVRGRLERIDPVRDA
ncbi:MAG: ABC transporter ATP-binding protein [Deltaproteobacteria bacterium]|nr:ABC transporter ATP-binding protein [Deltaproteobacteria bacterium]